MQWSLVKGYFFTSLKNLIKYDDGVIGVRNMLHVSNTIDLICLIVTFAQYIY